MSVHTFYRIGIWLPLAVPLLVAVLIHGFGAPLYVGPLQNTLELLLMSLVYGGIPYAPLAIWATWWVGGRSEPEIRRLMLRAPLLMVAVFVPIALLAGIVVGQPVPFGVVAVLGAIMSILLGYTYVALVAVLREYLGPRAA